MNQQSLFNIVFRHVRSHSFQPAVDKRGDPLYRGSPGCNSPVGLFLRNYYTPDMEGRSIHSFEKLGFQLPKLVTNHFSFFAKLERQYTYYAGVNAKTLRDGLVYFAEDNGFTIPDEFTTPPIKDGLMRRLFPNDRFFKSAAKA